MRPALAFLFVCVAATPASADNEAAKAHFKKGLAAYALGHYAEAASEYEEAFNLEPQSALLYDAAQAHRLAGNKERALLLYQNYLRLFPNASEQRDVRRLIETLRRAIAADARAGNSPPVTPILPPVGTSSTAEPSAPPATPSAVAPAPPAVAPAATAPQPKKRPRWVWGVVGGAAALVVIGVAVGLSVGLSGTDYPAASTTVTLR
jgi:tetratricopeptide (TPR) repeat protein